MNPTTRPHHPPASPGVPILLTPHQAAGLLNLKPRTLWGITQRRGEQPDPAKIPAVYIGRVVRYLPSALALWAAGQSGSCCIPVDGGGFFPNLSKFLKHEGHPQNGQHQQIREGTSNDPGSVAERHAPENPARPAAEEAGRDVPRPRGAACPQPLRQSLPPAATSLWVQDLGQSMANRLAEIRLIPATWVHDRSNGSSLITSRRVST